MGQYGAARPLKRRKSGCILRAPSHSSTQLAPRPGGASSMKEPTMDARPPTATMGPQTARWRRLAILGSLTALLLLAPLYSFTIVMTE